MTSVPYVDVFITQEPSRSEEILDRAIGAMTGLAIADAMGWITEFMRSKAALKTHTGVDWLDHYVSWPKRTGGRFNTYIDQINEGDYSDDTQLTLCVARSVNPDGGFDPKYFMKVELPLWMQYARGAGSTVTAAAKAATRKSASWNANFFVYRHSGSVMDYRESGANGAAMRVLPLAIANLEDSAQLAKNTWISSIVTHGHPRAIVGALVIAEAQRRVISGEGLTTEQFFPSLKKHIENIAIPSIEDFEKWEARWNQDSSTGEEFEAKLEETKGEMLQAVGVASESRERPIEDIAKDLGCFERSTRGSGVGTVAAALALFYRFGGNYKECVEHAVNLIGTDTDTIGAMAGALAGALGGTRSLPEQWAVKVQDAHYFHRVAESLWRIGEHQASQWELGPQTTSDRPNQSATEMDRASNFSRGQRISHPIFGRGWVGHVQTQEVRRKSGGNITLVDVEFDMGQSLRLRTRPALLRVDEDQIQAARARMDPPELSPRLL